MPLPALFSACTILNSLPVRDGGHPCDASVHTALQPHLLEETFGGPGMPLTKALRPGIMLRDPHQEGKSRTKQPARLLEPFATSRPTARVHRTPHTLRPRSVQGRAPFLLQPLLWGVALASVAPLYVLPDDAPGQLCPGQERDACSPSFQ